MLLIHGNMNKVLALCLSPDKGGLELYFLKLISYYRNSKSPLYVACSSKSYISQNISENMIECTYSHFLNKIISFFKLRNFIRENSLNTIHISWSKDVFIAVMLKIFTPGNIKIIYYRQMKISRPKKDIFHKFIYSKIHRVLVITDKLKSEAKEFLPIDKNKIIKLTYGIQKPDKEGLVNRHDFYKKNNMDPNKFTIGIFSRIEEQKGQHLVLESISKINHDIQLFIIGHCMDVRYKDELIRFSSLNKISDSIVFLGFTKSPMTLMPCFDLIILPTYEETFGLIVAEAMLMGTPVIGSDAGGVPEIITHKKNGLLFETKNHHDLKEKIELLIENQSMRDRIREEAVIYADENYNYHNHFKKLETIINNM